jgi:hypothetical protein
MTITQPESVKKTPEQQIESMYTEQMKAMLERDAPTREIAVKQIELTKLHGQTEGQLGDLYQTLRFARSGEQRRAAHTWNKFVTSLLGTCPDSRAPLFPFVRPRATSCPDWLITKASNAVGAACQIAVGAVKRLFCRRRRPVF